MFVGHYGVSFAAKRLVPDLPLWLLFIAVQLVDVLWAMFVLIGLEKVRIVPGITATNPLDLYYMPYTHSLFASLVWAFLAFFAYRTWTCALVREPAMIVGVAVLSHWFFDLIVHRPDLPLIDNTAKVGFGLWNYPLPAFSLEAILLFGGLWLYLRNTRPRDWAGRYGFTVLALILLGAQSTVFFAAPPPSPAAAAITALAGYIGFAAGTAWLERRRVPRAP